jgi:uncharacterized damage-inducible protein DinB
VRRLFKGVVIMQKDTFTLLAKYNKAANKKMNGLISSLSQEEWEKKLGGFFSSVRSLSSHIYIADFSWLKRFSKLREFKTLTGEFLAQNFSFKETIFEAKDEYLRLRPELDDVIVSFASELEDVDLVKSLPYNDSSGKSFERNFGGLLLQVFNHETHHRSMISLYLELLGRENDFNSVAEVL